MGQENISCRKEMKEVDWGDLYQKYRYREIVPATVETKVSELSREIIKRRGIYSFVFSLDTNDLIFTAKQIRIAHEKRKASVLFQAKGVY